MHTHTPETERDRCNTDEDKQCDFHVGVFKNGDIKLLDPGVRMGLGLLMRCSMLKCLCLVIRKVIRLITPAGVAAICQIFK